MTAAPLAAYPLTHEALRVDDNPTELPITHSRGIAIDPAHRCAPRVLAECCVCGVQFNLCDAEGEDIDALLARKWRCEAHRG